ncbi:MAG: hypothetical protein A3K65_08600 [Euryarchaeota archaeon RBG_16_68_12]|nr:MAG: hypothetical protein A3K65_08600 [Euryarchaeota archaeon RBG_16_68_12]
MNRRYVKATLFLVLLFVLFLPLFYLFSFGKNDGLQQTLQDSGGPAPTSWWTAPFSYGANPVETFLVGLLGFVVVAGAILGILRILKRMGGKDGPKRGPVDPPRA